jgi:hypothetical protein
MIGHQVISISFHQSLEIGETALGKMIKRPRVVRELDWIDNVWPRTSRPTEYPQVQLYCLMGVQDCFTDFHIDFGGTSVFYHIISGSKIFYFIPPTKRNLEIYGKWSNSPDQSSKNNSIYDPFRYVFG